MRSPVFPIVFESPQAEPDAHGQAALMLIESLLHGLIEKEVMSSDEVLIVLETACEIKVEIATAEGESRKRIEESLELLHRIRTSLSSDNV